MSSDQSPVAALQGTPPGTKSESESTPEAIRTLWWVTHNWKSHWVYIAIVVLVFLIVWFFADPFRDKVRKKILGGPVATAKAVPGDKLNKPSDARTDSIAPRPPYDPGAIVGQAARAKLAMDDQKWEEACPLWESVLQLDPNNVQALEGAGLANANMAEMPKYREEKHSLYEKASQMFGRLTKCDANNPKEWCNSGLTLNKVANIEADETRRRELLQQASNAYDKATHLDPNYAPAWGNWGSVLNDLAPLEENSQQFFLKAIEKHQEAVKRDPNFAVAYDNWGNSLIGLSKHQEGDEKRKRLQEAIEMCKKANDLDPKFPFPYIRWGIAYCELANLEVDEVKKRPYVIAANKKFEEATDLNPQFIEAWSNWGAALTGLALTYPQNSAERGPLEREAKEKFQRAEELGR
jgi:tetratricopeptide (TPR) repeat protein